MIRVVFDTNIMVSAMLNASGTPANVLRFALHRHVQLCVVGHTDALIRHGSALGTRSS